MTLPATTRDRLKTQLDALHLLVGSLDADALVRRPPSGKWSILENVAHLGRYHEVFLARMRRVLEENAPSLGRYRAEDDPEFATWLTLAPDGVMRKLNEGRAELIDFVDGLTGEQLSHTGVHPKLGKLNIPLWLEFFLLHEAHHLYRVLWLSKAGE